MKIIAAILAILTLFMSVQKPVLTPEADDPDKTTCSSDSFCGKKNDSCEDSDTPKKNATDPNKCCDMGICNPFGACCSYLLSDRFNLDIACTLSSLQKLILTDENGLSFYIQEVWKPPKFFAVRS